MITLKTSGDFKKTKTFFGLLYKRSFMEKLEEYAEEGLQALINATPVDTGKTALSWYYTIECTRDKVTITWHNSNNIDYVPIVILIQYGHATKEGSFVEGVDFINPALKPVFDTISRSVWEEVEKL